ncbi:YjjG family noncanonical pyrimidine nucleotidase [Flavobacterium sp. JP2137]|uniref:YjjG family noncanonical pyrimidine nucleotidase n=1 Tax=Flavobacterium sp. JP2137 TaxID=3414510 RepID=UPI003D2FDE7C
MMPAKFNDKTDIFFDLDHTLWDFERNSALAFEAVLSAHKLPFKIADFLQHYVGINEAYWERYSLNQITQSELRFGRLNDTFKALSFVSSADVVAQIADDYIERLPQFNHLYDGAISLLEYLQPKYHLHVITNGFHVVQQQKIKNANLDSFFKTVTNSEMAGVKKPDSKIFMYALNEAKTVAQQSVMIGDNLIADIDGAQKAGIDTIYFNEHRYDQRPELLQVHTLSQIKELL